MPRGGIRPGAGRPPRAAELVPKTIRLTPDTWAFLQDQATQTGRTVSEVIEVLVRK